MWQGSNVIERVDLATGTDELLAHIEAGVAILTLNRPEVRNALSDTLSPALREMIATLSEDARVRAVVLTGAGAAFCAGGDVKGMGGRTKREDVPRTRDAAVVDLARRQQTLTGALYAMPQPTLAVLPGPAAGAGFAIALACDLRVMADSAFVTTGYKRVALSGDYGASFFLTQLIGTARARELFFTGKRLGAVECEQLGIANRVVPAERLQEESMSLARELASGPTVAYRFMKRNLDLAMRTDLEACLRAEAEGVVATATTEDHQEAVRAFIEKREPRFRGR
ncbi:MAG: enoyl-CoA hydratase-related protein [Candidatus Binatia bacterium]|nr:enoyl-CoA hydratase-related protein [Candidatus Binatia bacterium]MDG2009684.1 enoyl-CoA hydratase-related protein [Candidatus Binatia bacterium]HAC81134.1 enoyl-CoA hydratase [Deltaproteobacteria bacterium]